MGTPRWCTLDRRVWGLIKAPTWNRGCPNPQDMHDYLLSFPFCPPRATTFVQQGLWKARCLKPLTQVFAVKAPPWLQTDIFSRTGKEWCIFFSQMAAFRKKHDTANYSEKQKMPRRSSLEEELWLRVDSLLSHCTVPSATDNFRLFPSHIHWIDCKRFVQMEAGRKNLHAY